MSIVDRVEQRREVILNRYPVGSEVGEWERELGHRDEFGPSEYGNYIATSNLIYAAVQLRARRLATVPVLAYRGSDENKVLQTSGGVPELLQHVNPHWTYPRLKRQTEQCMGLWGEAFWVVQKDRAGRPAALWWVRPDRMHPVPHPTDYLSGYWYEPSIGGERIPFRTDEVIWFRYPNPLDEFAGLSPLAAARLAADSHADAMKSNRAMLKGGMQLGGVISPPKGTTFSRDDARKLEHQLTQRLSGADKAHRWAILRFDAQVEKMAVSPRDAEWLGGLNFTVREVARAYGIPSPLLMDLEHATLANVREFDRMLWELALVPDEEFYVGELREQLLPMFGTATRVNHLAPDFSGVSALQESQTAVWDRERQQVESGLRTINEWRKSKGLPPVPWGDVWWAPVNKGPVSDATRTPAETATEGQGEGAAAAVVEDANRADAMRAEAERAADESAQQLLEEVRQMFDDFSLTRGGTP